jgi:ribosomal protein L32
MEPPLLYTTGQYLMSGRIHPQCYYAKGKKAKETIL